VADEWERKRERKKDEGGKRIGYGRENERE